jgi:DNA invertase Pin-like site-specific DNA recombinase
VQNPSAILHEGFSCRRPRPDSGERFTLNILLSFAQFEREIIAERTGDKMSAARRKGKRVDGIPVLGRNIAPDGGKPAPSQPLSSSAVNLRFRIFGLVKS